jgi:hypothetical protein
LLDGDVFREAAERLKLSVTAMRDEPAAAQAA